MQDPVDFTLGIIGISGVVIAVGCLIYDCFSPVRGSRYSPVTV